MLTDFLAEPQVAIGASRDLEGSRIGCRKCKLTDGVSRWVYLSNLTFIVLDKPEIAVGSGRNPLRALGSCIGGDGELGDGVGTSG